MSMSSAPNRYQPVSAQAEITRNYVYDNGEARMRKFNANNVAVKGTTFNGGAEADNLKVMPGEIVYSFRDRKRSNLARATECGLTSLNGVDMSLYNGNKEVFLRSIYFGGIAKTEYEDGKSNYGATDPLEHGFSVIGSGSYSWHNSGPDTIYAGDLLAVDMPDHDAVTSHRTYTKGTPQGKQMLYLRPFHKTTGEAAIRAMIDAFGRPNSGDNPGISTLNDEDLMENERLTPLQEEALALRKFVRQIIPRDEMVDIVAWLEDHIGALTSLMDSLANANAIRMARCVGVAMGTAPPGKTVAVMLSHYKA